PSGDLLGAGLIQSLREIYPDLIVSGIGGSKMIQAGCQSLYDLDELSVMGIIEPLKRLPRLLKIHRHLYQHYSQIKPDAFIGIDSPDFNLGLELKLRKQGIKTAHYVSPSVWAWRQNRIHKIARAVDLMLTLLPFEAKFYEKHQVPVKFVGHPLADKIPMQPAKEAVRASLGIKAERVIALLPGSRKQELKYLGKTFLEAAKLCYQAHPEMQFITSSINDDRDLEWRSLHQEVAPELPLHFYKQCSHQVMAAADAVLVTSGTATLETMLFKKPMVIAYKTSGFNYFLAKKLVKTPYIGLPNLLAQQALVPEFIQEAADPKALAYALLKYVENMALTNELQQKFSLIHEELLQNADKQSAHAIISLIKN
ncbi:MAG TPA: lipid-A-disaccharide synthase, partial [Gammaproteobacteria bacterium]|nr:lipid-A-disaccharide synthase [Gammaproteobacteria bacterium]